MADKDKMKCNVPRREVQGGKKFVVKACQGGKEKIVRFGDAKMTIKKTNRLGKEVTVLEAEALKVNQINFQRTIGRGELGTARWLGMIRTQPVTIESSKTWIVATLGSIIAYVRTSLLRVS